MPLATTTNSDSSFLGTGWSFPPTFTLGGVVMTSGEDDIKQSLGILFRTAPGERIFQPKFGVDMNAFMFEPMSTSTRTFLTDLIRNAILVYEPRIKLLALVVENPDPNDGSLRICVEYEVRATNSRFNLVFPFYRNDSNELRATVDAVVVES